MTTYTITERVKDAPSKIIETGLAKADAAARCKANNAGIPSNISTGRWGFDTDKKAAAMVKRQERFCAEQALPARFEVISGGKVQSVETTVKEARRQAKIHIEWNSTARATIKDRESGWTQTIEKAFGL